jgi:hypothetical protein
MAKAVRALAIVGQIMSAHTADYFDSIFMNFEIT